MTGQLCFRGNAAGLTLIPMRLTSWCLALFFTHVIGRNLGGGEKQGRVASAVLQALLQLPNLHQHLEETTAALSISVTEYVFCYF